MTEVNETPVEIKQCWAFHKDGTRCDMPAGHPGNHAVERTWTDAECHAPNAHPLPPAPVATPAYVPPPPAPPANDKCVACQHKHRGRECPGACECKEFIG